jgi:hypothetical protein
LQKCAEKNKKSAKIQGATTPEPLPWTGSSLNFYFSALGFSCYGCVPRHGEYQVRQDQSVCTSVYAHRSRTAGLEEVSGLGVIVYSCDIYFRRQTHSIYSRRLHSSNRQISFEGVITVDGDSSSNLSNFAKINADRRTDPNASRSSAKHRPVPAHLITFSQATPTFRIKETFKLERAGRLSRHGGERVLPAPCCAMRQEKFSPRKF